MFGIRFIRVEPTDFVLQFKRGQVVREGAGLAFKELAEGAQRIGELNVSPELLRELIPRDRPKS